MTDDQRLVAAAERGRREELAVDGVHLVVSTEHVTVARVCDGQGIWDVTGGPAIDGWCCSCQDMACHHVAAVQQVTQEVQ